MKTHRLAAFIATCSLFTFATAGCAEKARVTESSGTAAKPAAPANPPPVAPEADQPAAAIDPWTSLKACTFDQRDTFLAGLHELEARVDAQISELAAKRAVMNASNTSTKEWDFVAQEPGRSRTNLKSTNEEMAKATRATWEPLKERVGLAWVRTQDAYAKVKASTTN